MGIHRSSKDLPKRPRTGKTTPQCSLKGEREDASVKGPIFDFDQPNSCLATDRLAARFSSETHPFRLVCLPLFPCRRSHHTLRLLVDARRHSSGRREVPPALEVWA